MKKIITLFLIATFPITLFSQVDLGIPVATGKGGAANGIVYDWECIGINPANLGWGKNHRFSLSAMTFGISAQSKALDYGQLKNAIMHPSDTFSTEDRKAYAALFTDQDGLNLQTNINWLSVSLAFPKVGGFAMNMRDRSFGHVRLNKNAADILFMGKNAPIFQDTSFWTQPDSASRFMSKVLDGSRVSFMRYRELNFAYGVKLFGIGGKKDSSAISIYGGIGFKYLWGMGDFDMVCENGVLTGHSALGSQYGIKYDSVENFTPESTAGIFPSAGSGTAIDLGIGVGIGSKIKITVSAVDLGKITWNKNVLYAKDTLLPDTSQFDFTGINSWDASKQSNHLFNDKGIMKFVPGAPYTTTLPSRLRLGIGYQITKRIIAGADVVVPMGDNPANLDKAFFAAGTEIELARSLRISFGFSGNPTYGFSLPMGITFAHVFKIMEFSFATNDILTYLSHGSNPNVSLAVCLIRFNVDKKQ